MRTAGSSRWTTPAPSTTSGWVLVAARRSSRSGAARSRGPRPVDVGGAVVTPGLVNTHHHLYQTLTRARAQQADLFTWLRELYPVWAGIDAEAEYAAARTGLAELASRAARPSSTTTTSFRGAAPASSRRRSRRRASSGPHRRLARLDGPRRLGRRPAARRAGRGARRRARRDRAAPRRLPRAGPGARVQIAVAPCSPFSVTGRLMEESAALARRLGLVLHTHLAETVEEEAYCRELYGCAPVEYLERLGWLADDVWCAHCVHLSDAEVARFAETGTGIAHCPTSNLRLGAGVAPVRCCPGRGARRARRRRIGVERAQRPVPRGEAGAARRARPRWRGGDDGARGARLGTRGARRCSAATTSGRSSPGSRPTSRSGPPTGSSSAAPRISSPASSSRGRTGRPPGRRRRGLVRGGALVRADEADIARAHRAQARRFAA